MTFGSFLVCCLLCTVLWIVCKKLVYEQYWNPTIDTTASNLSGKLVAISGCDSGFGQQTAIKLYSMGFSVLATCLTEKGKKALVKQAENLSLQNNNTFHCVLMDITNVDDIHGMKSYLLETCLPKPLSLTLWCVINNAGILRAAEFDVLSLEDYQECMNVNFFGAVRVIKALIHTLRHTEHARIINIVSSGVMTPMYGYSAYISSKASLDAFSVILRNELKPFQCYVSSILPGANNTNLLDTMANMEFYNARVRSLDKDIINDYGSQYFQHSAKRFIMGTKLVTPRNCDHVIDTIVDSVIRQKPYARYIVGLDARLQYVLSLLPAFLQEFVVNEPLRPRIKPQMLQKLEVRSQSHFE